MCTSYESNRRERSDAFSQFAPPNFEYKREIYKDYLAPIFRRAKEGFSTDAASYGIVPRKHIPPGVKPFDTMNARSETVGEKRSFSGAWRRQQLCLIPCETFFEPNYESGKPVRWKIGMASGEPFAIAGLWREWADVDGTPELSFTMLTVNSDAHPLMNRFHKPGEEKRSVVIVRPGEYEAWLTCRSTDEAWSFLQLFPAEEMRAQAFPLPPREPKPKAKPKPLDDGQQSLLDE
jgi:putative SOS response-associated peptidase YedK